jgi:hypothetical protein
VDHVGGAAQPAALRGHLHHRHRRFRRDALDRAPDEVVEHEIAGHQDAYAREAADDGGRSRLSAVHRDPPLAGRWSLVDGRWSVVRESIR